MFTTAARYVENGGTDTPLQDGSLAALGPAPHHGWIWQDEHPNDAYGLALRNLISARYRMLPSTPDAYSFQTLTTGTRLLEELLPSLAPSALHPAHIVGCVPTSKAFFGSSSRPDLGGMLLLNQGLGSPWWVAEHLLHESMHLKLYDLLDGDTLMPSGGGMSVARPVITPWNPSMLAGANRWHGWRVLAAFHVYVHMALLSTVAERRAPELEAAYGPLSGMIDSRRARARARYLGHRLLVKRQCWDELGPVAQGLADWLHSLLDVLDPAPAPDDATLHLYLDLYRRENDRVQRMLADPPGPLRDALTTLARRDITSTRAILRDLDADQELAVFEAAVTDADLPDGYPEIRRTVEACLLAASPDGHRTSASGVHDEMVGEMVESGSDTLFALSTGIPTPVAGAKRQAVKHQLTTRFCDDRVGRLLAVHAAHLQPDAKILQLGAGAEVTTAWLVAGLGSRTDVDILVMEGAVVHPDAFDLILADATAAALDRIDEIVDSARAGGMLIIDHTKVIEPDTAVAQLRQAVLGHDKLVAVEIDWASGLLIAAKRT